MPPRLATALRGAVNAVFVVTAMIAISVLTLGPATAALSLVCPAHAWRRWTSFWVATWMGLTAFLIEALLGVRFVVSGVPLVDDAHLLMMNHRTRLDWCLLWPVQLRARVLHHVKIMLKAPLMAVPFGGWSVACGVRGARTRRSRPAHTLRVCLLRSHTAPRPLPPPCPPPSRPSRSMQFARFMFLRRRWDADAAYMDAMCRLIAADAAEPYGLLIFPEGTDLHPEGAVKSDAYAHANGLPRVRYTMHPHARGFVHAVRTLRSAARPLQSVCDATIAFSGGPIAQGEDALWTGAMPSRVHVHVDSYAAGSLPADDDGLAAWLAARFAEKEAALEHFYGGGGASLAAAFARVRGGPPPHGGVPSDGVAGGVGDDGGGGARGSATSFAPYAQPVLASAAAVATFAALACAFPLPFGAYVLAYVALNAAVTHVGGWQRFELARARL